MTHKPRLHIKTADKCNNSHWDMCCENKYLDFRIHAELFFTSYSFFQLTQSLSQVDYVFGFPIIIIESSHYPARIPLKITITKL